MKALLLLYYWPPSGGPGVQRGVKLCSALREEGIEPAVVTVDPETYSLPGEYAPDPTLASDVPADLHVIRTASGARPQRSSFLAASGLARAAAHFFPADFFERQAGWLTAATLTLLHEVERTRPDVLLTSSQPYTAHLAGRAVKLATGFPWVADFRDPWTFSWGRSWPSRRALAWEELREEEVLGDADVVVANTPGSRAEWLARHAWLDPRKVVVVRNGYDPADFDVAAAAKPEGEFRVVHAGSFRARPPSAARTGLRALLDRSGPEPLPYDLATHSPAPLFEALARLDARVRARVRIRLVGPLHPGWMRLAEELGVAKQVDARGPSPHRAATAEVLAADLLWLPSITRRDAGPVANVPAKTYEYLGSGRPILALAGLGDLRDLLAASPRARIVRATPGASAPLAERLAAAVRGEGPAAEPPDPEDARPYRRAETGHGIAAALRSAASAVAAPARDVEPSAAIDAARAGAAP